MAALNEAIMGALVLLIVPHRERVRFLNRLSALTRPERFRDTLRIGELIFAWL
jgi:hypothetical protein